MTYNVGSFSKYMADSSSQVASMISEAGADVVGLNEVDSCNTRHDVDQAAVLARQVGDWQSYFGRAMAYRGGAYGNAVIVPKDTKVIASYVVTLDKGDGSEQRSVAVVETDRYVYGACHLDYATVAAQLAQVKTVNEWFKEKYSGCSKPVFFGGDMNALPDSEAIAALKESWDLLSVTDKTFSSQSPAKCIDYIFHYKSSAPVTVAGSAVMSRFSSASAMQTSDHLPVYVDVKF